MKVYLDYQDMVGIYGENYFRDKIYPAIDEFFSRSFADIMADISEHGFMSFESGNIIIIVGDIQLKLLVKHISYTEVTVQLLNIITSKKRNS
jgi:hypothetical protein